jgi:hypothetical protein
MSVERLYTDLLEKVASSSAEAQIQTAYGFCMQKKASATDLALAALAGAVPAYLVGSNLGKQEEASKHKNYAVTGALAGFLGPKLLSAVTNPSAISDSVSGIDADYIRSLQLEDIE